MEFLCEETFTSEDEKQKSRNLWYGSAGITAEGEYGTDVVPLAGTAYQVLMPPHPRRHAVRLNPVILLLLLLI